MTRYRGKLIWLGVFVTVCLTLIWTVFVTLQRNVGGETKPYAAVFSDVSGALTPGSGHGIYGYAASGSVAGVWFLS